MKRFSRRSLLAASVAAMALVAGRGLAQQRRAPAAPKSAPELLPRTGGLDVAIVGAGAAGIAAARRLIAAGRRVVVLEAAGEVGGRCLTDNATFGVAYDRGAHALYSPDINPVAKLAAQSGLDIYPAPPGQRIRIGRRYAREGEMEELLADIVRANRAIADAARRGDVSAAQTLPKDLGDWRATIEFMLGPFQCGKDLAEVSAADLARGVERDAAVFCRQGLGALIAKLAAGLPLQLSTPVTRIALSPRAGVELETAKGQVEARAVVVTVSTNVLTAGKIKFQPELPKRQLDAAAKLKLGSYDRIALELPGNPLGLRADELVFEKAGGNRTASIFANVAGTTLCTIDVGGSFGSELAAKGQPAMIDFALGWVGDLYGGEIKGAVKRRQATNWNDAPWTLGAMSAAAPGAQSARKALMEPVNNRIWFAGEAAHETLWGTVGGAWESGERAADALNKLLGRL
jgi:monoamine oxidase